MGVVALVVTMYLGFSIQGGAGLADHFLFALFATLVAVLAQCMSMFYFIGTGKQVKDLLASHPDREAFILRTREFKSKVFPPATLAITFTMAAWIVGGGVDTHVLPVWIHTSLALLALATNVFAFLREFRYMSKNNALLDEVAVRVGSAPEQAR
jgi:Mn2+/Fe2+ NRAMP family transporter